jgi:Tfp pilus assembly protein PilX
MTSGKNTNQRGFALLFSVLVSSLLLSIGLSIFSIAIKELSISTSGRQSQLAFYAADSGRECARYWDRKFGTWPTLANGDTADAMFCNGQTVTIATPDIYNSTNNQQITNKSNKIYLGTYGETAVTEPYFEVSLGKCWRVLSGTSCTNTVTGSILTRIQSFGHDLDNDNKLERAVRELYY